MRDDLFQFFKRVGIFLSSTPPLPFRLVAFFAIKINPMIFGMMRRESLEFFFSVAIHTRTHTPRCKPSSPGNSQNTTRRIIILDIWPPFVLSHGYMKEFNRFLPFFLCPAILIQITKFFVFGYWLREKGTYGYSTMKTKYAMIFTL